jgi:hypothetical protein
MTYLARNRVKMVQKYTMADQKSVGGVVKMRNRKCTKFLQYRGQSSNVSHRRNIFNYFSSHDGVLAELGHPAG